MKKLFIAGIPTLHFIAIIKKNKKNYLYIEKIKLY
jgi:hypothetical protein